MNCFMNIKHKACNLFYNNSLQKTENQPQKSPLNKQVDSQLGAIARIVRFSLASIGIGIVGLGAYFAKQYFIPGSVKYIPSPPNTALALSLNAKQIIDPDYDFRFFHQNGPNMLEEKIPPKTYSDKEKINHSLIPFLDEMTKKKKSEVSIFGMSISGVSSSDLVCGFWGDQHPTGIIEIKDYSKAKIENRFRELVNIFHPDKCSPENQEFCTKTVVQLGQVKEDLFEENRAWLLELPKDQIVAFDCIDKASLTGYSKQTIDYYRRSRLNEMKKFSSVFDVDHFVKLTMKGKEIDKLEDVD